jgi:hypothetical protein
MQYNRRNFLRTAGAASLLAIPGSGLLAKVLESSQRFDPGASFSLQKLSTLANSYVYPVCGNFDTGNWQLRFKHYNFYPGTAFEVGTLALGKTTVNDECNFSLNASTAIFDRKIRRFFETKGTLTSCNDVLSTPKKWQISTNTVQPENPGTDFCTLRKLNGTFDKKQLVFKNGSAIIRKVNPPAALSWRYGLVDVVQNMAKNGIEHVSFDLLDAFDTTTTANQMRFDRKQEVMTGLGGSVTFGVYDHTGAGTIPTVYWVDDMNRVVFIISGMEAWILQPQ